MIKEGQIRGVGPKSKVYCVDGPADVDSCQEFRYSASEELNQMVREWHTEVARQKREYLRNRTRWGQFRDWLRKRNHRIRLDAFGWRFEVDFHYRRRSKPKQ